LRFPGIRLPADIIAVKCAAFLSAQAAAAVRTLPWSREFLCLAPVTEEGGIPADGGAIHLRPSSDGVTDSLVQDLAAGITLVSNVETSKADASELGSGGLHAATFERAKENERRPLRDDSLRQTSGEPGFWFWNKLEQVLGS
jgi:hypothetical protein